MNKQNKKRYQDLVLQDQKIKAPSVPDYGRPPANCKETGANDLTRLICSFINLSGYQAERISTTGRMLDQKKTVTDCIGRERTIGSVKFIPGTSTKGSADISATIQGRSIKIEVKWEKDRQSTYQKEYEQAITKAGGIYFIAKTFDEFLLFYDQLIEKLNYQDKLF